MLIHSVAYPRAALVGNPSDGYHGKTIAFVFRNYCASVDLFESPELEFAASRRDYNLFSSLEALTEDIRQYGYYGGIRLLKAAAKKFYEYCQDNRIHLPKRNFTIRYGSYDSQPPRPGRFLRDHHCSHAGHASLLPCQD